MTKSLTQPLVMWGILMIIIISMLTWGFGLDYRNRHFLDNHRIIEETCEYDISKCKEGIRALYPKENRFVCIEKIIPADSVGCPNPKWAGDCEFGDYLHCEWEDSVKLVKSKLK